MAEEVTEKQQQEAATTQQAAAEAVTEQVTVVEKKSKGGLWIVIIIVLIALLAFAGFYFVQQLRDKQDTQSDQIAKEDLKIIELDKQLSSMQTRMETVQSQLKSVDADVTDTDEIINKKLSDFTKRQNEKLETTQKELKLDILQVKRQLGKTRGDWLLADAEYLLSIANQRLHLTGDIKTTLEALKAADQRLRESGDAGGFKVREQITKEIAALKTVRTGDIVGSYSALQLLIDKVGGLALILPYAGKPLTPSKEIHSHKSNDEHGPLAAALKQVEGYVTIRHTDQPVDKILTPVQAEFIKQQLAIKLEMIKIALVQKNTRLYIISIDDALKWLKDNFTLNDAGKEFATELNKLKDAEVQSELPDISLSLKMLRDISKLRIETDKALDDSDDSSLAPEKTPETGSNSPIAPVTETTPEVTPIPASTQAEKSSPAPEETASENNETAPAAAESTDMVTEPSKAATDAPVAENTEEQPASDVATESEESVSSNGETSPETEAASPEETAPAQ